MAGHSISGLTDPVIVGTGGDPGVPKTNLSQPAPAFKLAPACVPVLSESSPGPNIFPGLVRQTNPLRPWHDWNVATHANEEFYHSFLCNAPVLMPPPYSPQECLEWYSTCFDIGRFCYMLTFGIELQVRARLNECCDMAVAGWARP